MQTLDLKQMQWYHCTRAHGKGRAHTGGIGKGRKPKLESVWCAHCRGAKRVILNWQRPLWEGDQEAVKTSGRDEPVWVVIPMCMEAMLRISLYSCPYLKLAKTLCLSYYCLCLLFSKIGEEGRTDSAWKRGGSREKEGVGGGRGERWPKQCMYIWINE
jgi:hypothetical protein